MRRFLLACALLLLSAAGAARSQSISVLSHTTIVPGQQAMAECGTIMNDVNTVARYPYVWTQCSLWRQVPGNIDGVMIAAFNCPAGTTSRCRNTYPTAAGETYAASANHWLGLYLSNAPTVCNGYYDPYRYLINPIPDFNETGTIGVRAGAACWSGSEGVIAASYSNSVTTFAISPTDVTLAPGRQISFSAVGQIPLWSVIQGPGTINSSGTYTAPASISGTQVATIQGCNIYNGADCATARVTVQNPTIAVTPTGQEVLPQGTLALKATLTPNTFPQTVTWKVTPAGAGTINASGVYTAPTNDQLPAGAVELTAQACSTATPTLCGTATFTVPKVDITVTGPSSFLVTPGSTFTLGANAIGPVTAQEVTWLPSTGTLSPIGFNTIRYTPPAITAAQTATFTVCLKASPSTCGKPDYSLVLVPPVIITSAGTWTAGTTSAVTITGTGFGTAPQVSLSDTSIPITIVSRNNTTIVLNAPIPVSSGGRILTVTVQSATAGQTPSASANITVAKATLAASPASAQLQESQSQSFSSTCTAGGSPCTVTNPISWSTTLGTIVPTGTSTAQYTAPASVASTTTATIKACWSLAPELCATAQVTVNALTVAVNPATANVNGCSTKQFAAQVTNAPANTVTWSIASGAGAVDTNGLYTAPCPVTAQSTVQVKACSTVNTQKCGTAQVTLVPVSVDVTPKTVSVPPGGSQQFAAVVQGASNTTVTWSISPASGSIDVNGLYVAPATLPAGTAVTVTATSKADNTTKGTAQITLVAASAVLTPATLTFAAQDVGTTSAAQAITLSNQGTSSFSLSGITTTGDFTQTSNCGASVAPGASCTINVQFAPTANGTRTGTLRVADTAPGSPHIANLSGTGRGPAASLSPLSLDFGGQRAGFPTAARTITLTNTGAGPMAISSIAVDGEFTQTNACPTSLAAGASCAISVKFSPAAASLGLLTGTLRVYDNAAGSPHSASVQGSVLGGFHDSATCTGSSGWAWDSARPNTPINVYIFEGSNLLATVLADKYRSDLVGGAGNGYHGFDWPMLASLRDGLSHTLTIRFSSDPSSLPIPGSPKSVTCVATPSYGGYHDTASCQGLAGWGWDANQPNTAITLYVFQGTQYLGSVPANLYRQDLLNAGIGDGRHGFNWPIPSSLVDGQSHSLTLRFGSSSSSLALSGSPKSILCTPAPDPTASIAWIQTAESSWGPAGTLTAAGYAEGGTGGVQLFWRERSSAGVWSGWTSVAYQPSPAADTTWSNTISSGSPTDKCHWFDAYVKYSGVTSATFHYTGASGCP